MSEQQGGNSPPDSSPRAPAREAGKPGRPTKLTPEVAATILQAIKGGMFRYQACALAGITRRTLSSWEKAAANGDETYIAFIDELELAQDSTEGQLMARHHALATGRQYDEKGKLQPINGETVPALRVQLEAIQFQLRNGGSRPWADLKKLELTGKDGERLSGSEVTPAAAAALVRAEFGDQARQALAEEQAAASGEKPPET